MEIREWLKGLELEQYTEIFEQNDIDESILKDLRDEDLKEMGITSFGHRKKILLAVSGLQPRSAPNLTSASTPLTHAAAEENGDTPRKDIKSTATTLEDFLQDVGMSRYLASFRENGIDLDVLRKLTDEQLKELGVDSVGHRATILYASEQQQRKFQARVVEIKSNPTVAEVEELIRAKGAYRAADDLHIYADASHVSAKFRMNLRNRGPWALGIMAILCFMLGSLIDSRLGLILGLGGPILTSVTSIPLTVLLNSIVRSSIRSGRIETLQSLSEKYGFFFPSRTGYAG